MFEHLAALGIEAKRGRALDFGCGVGRLTQALAERFDAVHGVDIAASMIDLAERHNRFGDRCKYHLNEKDELSLFADGSFDFVLTFICLQHMEPRYARRYLAEFARIVAPGGVLYFQLPAAMTVRTRLRRALGGDAVLHVEVRLAPLVARLLGLAPLLRSLQRRWQKQAAAPSAYVMEMHAQSPHEVRAYLESIGFVVRSAERDQLTGDDFVSYRYVAMRK